MAIQGTSTDYTGRLRDIYISGTLNPLSTATQTVHYSFGKPSKFVAGVQKLIQRYLISLVNSGFVEQLQSISGSNVYTAKKLFGLYNAEVVDSFRNYQNSNPSTFLDEQLDTVQLTNLTSTGASVNISLQLNTKAGSSVTFLLPLPLN
jgi:hypothetical protein